MLAVRQQPPISIFPGRPFHFSVVLDDVRRNVASLGSLGSLTLEVYAIEATEQSGRASSRTAEAPKRVDVGLKLSEQGDLILPVREGGPPLNITGTVSITSEELQGKRVQLVVAPTNTTVVRPVTTSHPGMFVAQYALVVLSTPSLPDEAVPSVEAGEPATPRMRDTFADTQVGIIPADPETPGSLLRSWTFCPDLFFKDEGSKDRCMDAEVALVSASKDAPNGPLALVTGIKLHLNVHLVYSDFTPSPEFCSAGGRRRAGGMTLLHVSNGTVRHIDPDTGRTKIKFRVNDVSKNHDGRPFRLAVSADLADGAVTPGMSIDLDGPVVSSHVASAYSHCIEVRSKRRKPKRGSEAAAAAEGGAMNPLAGAAAYARPPSSAAGPARHAVRAPAVGGDGKARSLPRAMNNVINWANRVIDLLQHTLQWQSYTIEGVKRLRCPVCGADTTLEDHTSGQAVHDAGCLLCRAIADYGASTQACLTTLVEHVHGAEATRRAQEKAAATNPAATGAGVAEAGAAALANMQAGGAEGGVGLTAPPLSRDESMGTMFRRQAQRRAALGASVSAVPAVGGVKREREDPAGQSVADSVSSSTLKRHAHVGVSSSGEVMLAQTVVPPLPGAPDGADSAPVLARGTSNESFASLGDGSEGGGFGSGLPFMGGMVGSVPPPPSAPLVTQASVQGPGGDGWILEMSRQASVTAAPSNGAVPPMPPGGASFFRGSSSSSLLEK